MKTLYTGLEAVEMLKKATDTYTTATTTTDPWWGDKTTITEHVVINGKTYTKDTDNGGWPVLWAE